MDMYTYEHLFEERTKSVYLQKFIMLLKSSSASAWLAFCNNNRRMFWTMVFTCFSVSAFCKEQKQIKLIVEISVKTTRGLSHLNFLLWTVQIWRVFSLNIRIMCGRLNTIKKRKTLHKWHWKHVKAKGFFSVFLEFNLTMRSSEQR